MKSALDLISDGLKQGHIFLYSLGDIANIRLEKNKRKILKKAIGKKDYYEIKSILLNCNKFKVRSV